MSLVATHVAGSISKLNCEGNFGGIDAMILGIQLSLITKWLTCHQV